MIIRNTGTNSVNGKDPDSKEFTRTFSKSVTCGLQVVG